MEKILQSNPSYNMSIASQTLDKMHAGEQGLILELNGPEPIIRRLMEMGIIEDTFLEVVHEAPFGKDPLAVRVRGGLLALRRSEAKYVTVQRG